VSPFVLDKFEVTVGRFRQFVAAYPGSRPTTGQGAHPLLGSSSGWQADWDELLPQSTEQLVASLSCDSQASATWTADLGDNETRPINCLSWTLAFAFCAWDGGRLPTETEWHYAAAGGSEERYYPWSVPPADTTIDTDHASYGEAGKPIVCRADGVLACSYRDLWPVGSRPKGNGRWGHADLLGNVGEWVLDWHYYDVIEDCVDCARTDPPATSHPARAWAGGAYNTIATAIANTRFASFPEDQFPAFGVRCARDH
jgi:formylglycine-generating enzyme required for sulfatase activity